MTSSPDIDLITKVQNGDEKSLIELTNRHSGLIYNQAKRFSAPFKAVANSDEFFSNRFEVVYNACLSFFPSKSQFSTHIANSMRYHCLKGLKKLVGKQKEELNYSPEEITDLKDSNFVTLDKLNEIETYLKLIKNKRTREIFELKYILGWTFSAIGSKFGLSHTRIEQINEKELARLKKLIKL